MVDATRLLALLDRIALETTGLRVLAARSDLDAFRSDVAARVHVQ